jgi:hypothetical protein
VTTVHPGKKSQVILAQRKELGVAPLISGLDELGFTIAFEKPLKTEWRRSATQEFQ